MRKLQILSLLLALIFSGCGVVEIDNEKLKNNTNNNSDNTEVVIVTEVNKDIVNVLKEVPLKDCITLYKIFAGAYQYVDTTNKPHTTKELFELIDKVQKEYEWDKEKYPNLTDVIEKDLISKGFEEDKEIASNKKLVVDTFCVYANSILEAMKEKK